MTDVYDLIIIGGGPAGTAAGVYAARKRLKTLLITAEFGGQSTVSPDIQNWIGTPSISGVNLAQSFKEHLQAYADDVLTIEEGQKVLHILQKEDTTFEITTDKESIYRTKTILVATGADRRRLSVPGADTFEHKGVTYCASCDGPLFTDQDVVVVGGGNAGFETAAQLLAYAKSVTLLQRSGAYRADQITVDRVLAHPNMTGLLNAGIKEVKGDTFVTSVTYLDTTTQEEKELAVSGVFVEIGLIPTTSFVADLVELDEYKRITIDPWTQKTSVEGVWAAGDCSNIKYHQNNIAAGDAVRALEDLYLWLHAH